MRDTARHVAEPDEYTLPMLQVQKGTDAADTDGHERCCQGGELHFLPLAKQHQPLYVIPLYATQRIVFFLIWSLASFSVFPKARMKSFCLGMLCLESGVFAYYLLDALVDCLGLSSSDISMVAANVVLVFLLGKELITWFSLERRRAEEKNAQLPQRGDRAPANESDMTEAFNAVAPHYRLTKRERELLPFLLLGRRPEYIGKALFIEPSTVKTHIRNIYGKMAVGKKTGLIYTIENWNTGDGP